MRVLFVQQQPCIRTLKYAVALRDARPDLCLGFAFQGETLSAWYGTGDELFDHWWSLGDEPATALAGIVRQFAPDVIHSHNLPDSLTVLALDVAGGRVPVVHDVHDLQSLRHTPYEAGFPEPRDPLALEKVAVETSTAVVGVSDEMVAEMRARHRVPAHTLTFANYALARDLPDDLPDPERLRRGPVRVVYQGTLSTNGGHYDLRLLFEAIVASGVRLDIFPGRPAPEYRDLADRWPLMSCHPTLEPRRLLQVLTGYDFGWAGFNDGLNGAHLDTALPNKAFEYIGCGLPVLTLGHKALARLVAEEGVGVSLSTLDDLDTRLRALDEPALRRRAAAARHGLTVEAHVQRLVCLYETVT